MGIPLKVKIMDGREAVVEFEGDPEEFVRDVFAKGFFYLKDDLTWFSPISIMSVTRIIEKPVEERPKKKTKRHLELVK